jgi:hypothetical protein
LLPFHIFAGIVCVIAGAMAALSRKGPGRHPRFGDAYFWGLVVVSMSSTAISVLRWPRDIHLLALGFLAVALASIGYVARKVRWTGWLTLHVLGMGLSYVVLLTAFYVDNGPHLPVWRRLPSLAFWIGPSLIGLPLVALGLGRHARPFDDLRRTAAHLKRWMLGP